MRRGSIILSWLVGLGFACDASKDEEVAELPRSAPEAEGIRSEGVLALVEALESEIEVHSLMLLRHGKVVAEGWWTPYSAEDIHVTYSVTKSFNGTAVGLAADEGLLDLDESVLSIFPDLAPPEPSPLMEEMRIRDLLMMATGHQADTIDVMRARADGAWTEAFLATDVQYPPGTRFLYHSGAAYMLGAIVQRKSGLTVEEYLRPRLFDPLGIEHPLWGKSAEGVNLADGGLSVRTEDLARFGQLYLQRGVWNDQRILTEEWVHDATESQIASGTGGNWGAGYGYQFWLNREGGFRADGSLGQFVFVLPEQDIVLALTSSTDDMDRVMNLVWQYLLPSTESDALPEDSAAHDELSRKLGALTLPPVEGSITSPRMGEVSGATYTMTANVQGMESIRLDFADTPTLVLQDSAGEHTIPFGFGEWVRARTRFNQHVNELFDTPEQGIAASGGWTSDDVFVAKLCFNETPYTITATFTFTDDGVSVDMLYNIRWGSLGLPRLTGTR